MHKISVRNALVTLMSLTTESHPRISEVQNTNVSNHYKTSIRPLPVPAVELEESALSLPVLAVLSDALLYSKVLHIIAWFTKHPSSLEINSI